jgi:predicted nucleic acid-binding protein
VALLNPKDALNHQALECAREVDRRKVGLLSTDAVLIKASVWIGRVQANREWEIVRLEPALMTLGERRYRKYRDKSWSVTDCISMELMLQVGLTEVATFDKHFREGGFNLLMP